MPKMSNIEILELPKQPVLSVKFTTRVEELPKVIGETFHKISHYLKSLNIIISDVPFVAFHNNNMNNLDVEIGFHTPKLIAGHGDIKESYLPERKVVFCMYRGPYGEMEPLYNEMTQWVKDNGYQLMGTFYEYYYNGPEFPESELLTKVVIPVK